MMRKALIALAVLAVIPSALFAQGSRLFQRSELVTIESGDNEILEVFSLPSDDGGKQYFLSAGHLGFGDDFVQVQLDPLSELFIPLGGTIAESLEALEQMKALYKTVPGTFMEVEGCLAIGIPKDEKMESVKITFRKGLMSKLLEFSIEREGYTRAAHIAKSEFNALIRGVKIYKKLHRKEA